MGVVGAWSAWQRVFASDRAARRARSWCAATTSSRRARCASWPSPAVGENILTLDLEALARLRSSPWVADATVTPRAAVTVRRRDPERVPLALAELDRLYLVDEDGDVIDVYGPRTGAFDLPIVAA